MKGRSEGATGKEGEQGVQGERLCGAASEGARWQQRALKKVVSYERKGAGD